MTRALKPVDIARLPDLLRLVQEVRESGQSRVLRDQGEDVAMLVPIAAANNYPWRTKTAADFEAFRLAAGGWSDVDTDELLAAVYADREIRDSSDREL